MKILKFALTVLSGAMTALLIADLYPEILGWWEATKSPTLVTILWLVVWGIQGWVFPYPENEKAETDEAGETCETPDEPSGMVGLCRDENGNLVVCLGLIEDGQAIVYDQDDQEAKTYTVFANSLTRVDD